MFLNEIDQSNFVINYYAKSPVDLKLIHNIKDVYEQSQFSLLLVFNEAQVGKVLAAS